MVKSKVFILQLSGVRTDHRGGPADLENLFNDGWAISNEVPFHPADSNTSAAIFFRLTKVVNDEPQTPKAGETT